MRLLGPVDVVRGGPPGEPRPVSGLRRRALLAALALADGEAISTGQLTEIVWAGAAPPGADSTLQSHISYLRGVLGGKEAIRAARPGYALGLGADGTDVRVARRLLSDGTKAADPRDGVPLLQSALALWRGRPLADAPGRPWLDDQARQLELLRVQVQRALAQALLAAGDPAGAIPGLEHLVAGQPLDEQAHGQLMLALYRSGRQADALAVYRRLRDALRDGLGIDPGPPLRDLETAILRQDPALAAAPRAMATPGGPSAAGPAAATARARPRVPAQLPPAVRGFAGRLAELARLDAVAAAAGAVPAAADGTAADGTAADGTAGDGTDGVGIAVVSGGGGAGKTALAVHWAHRVRGRFPGGQLYVDLRGFSPSGQPLDPAQAMREFLEALGVAGERIPASLPAQAALFRTLLDGQRVLVVLDNARDAAQVRPLLPASPGCLVLVTSRDQLAGLVATEAAAPLALGPLSAAEARDLLSHRLGAARVAAEPAAAGDIITACARLPLALSIAASRALTSPALPLAALAAELRGADRALDPFGDRDEAADVRAVFSWSYRALSEDAARMFRLLGVHPGPDFTVAAAASIAAVPAGRARTLLAELTGASLLTGYGSGRYAFHDLLRAYAADQALACDSPAERDAALRRVLDCYLQTAHHAAGLIKPERNPIDVAGPLAGTAAETISSRAEADAWFAAEEQVLMACIREAAAAGHSRAAWQIAWAAKLDWFRRGRWPEMITAGRIAADAARDDGQPAWQGDALYGLGCACLQLNQVDEAEAHFLSAQKRHQAAGSLSGEGVVCLGLMLIAQNRRRFADAIGYARQALHAYQMAGDRGGQAQAMHAIGWCHEQLGELDAAVAACHAGIALASEEGQGQVEAETWHTLGTAYLGLARHRQAMDCFQRSLEIGVARTEPYLEAAALAGLGDVRHETGDHPAAREAWLSALRILDDISHPEADEVRAKLG